MISIRLAGRLGNHLFQYAAGRAAAHRGGFDFCVPRGPTQGDTEHETQWLGGALFDCDLGQPYRRQWRTFREAENAFTPIPPRDRLHLDGWWQSPRYFDDLAATVRSWFPAANSTADPSDPDRCVIHFRAQDGYLREPYIPPPAYFDAAIATVRRHQPHVRFEVITDNPTLARERFPDFPCAQHDLRTDFSAIRHARFKIISASSFSWWAAWLGLPDTEMVIAPDRWLNHNFNVDPAGTFYPHDIATPGFSYL